MKMRILLYVTGCIYVLGSAVFQSCSKKKQSTENGEPDSAQVDSLTLGIESTQERKNVKSGKIEDTTAMREIFAAFREPKIKKLVGYSYGGTICVKDFFPATAPQSTDQGVLMWYCLDSLAPISSNRFFLAFEPVDINAVPAESSTTMPSRNLRRPIRTFSFPGTIPPANVTAVRKQIQDTPFTERQCSDAAALLPVDDARKMVGQFKAWSDRNLRTPTTPYNLINWAYFQNNAEGTATDGVLKKLVKDATYIRYYFAFDGSKVGPNTIRVILFAVGSNGKSSTGYVVQKSIP